MDIYNNKLDELNKTNENEIKNQNDHLFKIESETTTGDEEKLKSQTRNQSKRNSINKYRYYQREK